jgi:hypothetical protein
VEGEKKAALSKDMICTRTYRRFNHKAPPTS